MKNLFTKQEAATMNPTPADTLHVLAEEIRTLEAAISATARSRDRVELALLVGRRESLPLEFLVQLHEEVKFAQARLDDIRDSRRQAIESVQARLSEAEKAAQPFLEAVRAARADYAASVNAKIALPDAE